MGTSDESMLNSGSLSDTALPARPPRVGQSPPLDRTHRSDRHNQATIARRSRLPNPEELVLLPHQLPSHPLSLLLLIAVIGGWLFLYILRPQDQQLVIFGRPFTDCEALIGLSLVTVVVILVTSVVSLLVLAFAFGMVLVGAHGAFRAPEDLFLDGQDTWPTGLFSFVRNKGPASSLGIPLGPAGV